MEQKLRDKVLQTVQVVLIRNSNVVIVSTDGEKWNVLCF